MELAVCGASVESSWDLAIAEATDRGDRPFELTGLPRARLRYERRVGETLAFTAGADLDDIHTEERLVSPDGTVEGTPDLVVVAGAGCTVVDFKTGLVTDINGELPRAAYARQIQIYAFLASAQYRVTPIRGVLMSFKQGMVDVDVSPTSIDRAVGEARVQRAAFNQRSPGTQPAEPAEETCLWCDYQALCDGYWQAVRDGVIHGPRRSIRGTILGDPEYSQNGLTAVKLHVEVGAEPGAEALIAEIPAAVSAFWSIGDVVSITGLGVRAPEDLVFRYGPRSLTHRWLDGA